MSRLDDIKVQLPHERLHALVLIEDLQREVARVCRDRAFLLDLVERAAEFAQFASEQPPYLPWQDGERISAAARQWRIDAGYGEGEG